MTEDGWDRRGKPHNWESEAIAKMVSDREREKKQGKKRYVSIIIIKKEKEQVAQ